MLKCRNEVVVTYRVDGRLGALNLLLLRGTVRIGLGASEETTHFRSVAPSNKTTCSLTVAG